MLCSGLLGPAGRQKLLILTDKQRPKRAGGRYCTVCCSALLAGKSSKHSKLVAQVKADLFWERTQTGCVSPKGGSTAVGV